MSAASGLKTFRRVVALLAVFWIMGCAPMGADAPADRVSDSRPFSGAFFPHEKSDLAPDPSVRFGRLDSGLRYVLLENPEPKDRVSMHLDVQAGSLHETEAQRGLAHFLEHMLFNGSENFPPGELVKYFQRIGMDFGPDANARTGFEETVYDILLPDGGTDSIAEGLLVLRDYAAGALLLQEEIERERGVILAEKQARDSASYRLFKSTFRFEMQGTRAARRLPIGTEAVIRKADRTRLKRFYDAWYRPKKMVLVMVGDFDAAGAESMIKDRFSDVAPRAPEPAAPALGDLDHRGVTPFHHYEEETGETTVSIEVLSTVPAKNDSLALQKEKIAAEIADRIVQNRLDRMLETGTAPFTSAYISSGRFLGRVDYAEISAKGPPQDWQRRLSTIEQVLRQALMHGFHRTELDRVRKEKLSELNSDVRKAGTRDSRDLARKLIRGLNENRVFQSPAQRKKIFGPYISALTVEDVNEALRKSWGVGHRLVLVTGNARIGEDADSAREKIKDSFVESRNRAVSAYDIGRSAEFPFFELPEKTPPPLRRQTIEDLEIVQADWENGTRLNVKKTDFKDDEVLVRLAFGYGRSGEPQGMAGLGEVAEGVVNQSGVGPLTRDALEQALAGRNTAFDFVVRDEHFRFQGSTVSGELELAFQLLHGFMTAPAFRKEAFDLTVRRLDQRYEKMAKSIEGQMKIVVDRFLAGGDSRFGMADPQTRAGVSLADVQNWLLPAMQRARLEVSVVGDIEPEKVVSLAARYLGTLAPRGEVSPPRRKAPRFPEGGKRTVTVPTGIVKGLAVTAWPTDDFWDIDRTRRLSVLGSVFSEKLRERIRERLGVAYSPYAYNDSSRAYPGYGRLMAVVPTDPEKVKTVVAEVHDIARTLARTPLTEDEMKRVMEPILTGLKDLRRTNKYWIDSVMTGSLRHPEQLRWARSIVKDYRSIGIADVHKMARKYLDSEASATVVVVPEK